MSVARPFEDSAVRRLAPCLKDGSGTKVENLVHRTIRGRRVLVFNFQTYSSLGEGSTVTTCAAFQSRSYQLPVFQIRTKGILDRWQRTMATVVNLDTDPEFAKRFVLFCVDEGEKHRFFTSSKLRHICQSADHFQIQSSPDWLIMFRPGRVVSARNLHQFVSVTLQLHLVCSKLGPNLSCSVLGYRVVCGEPILILERRSFFL